MCNVLTLYAAIYDDLVHYFKYASTAYVSLIAFRANGATVVKKVCTG